MQKILYKSSVKCNFQINYTIISFSNDFQGLFRMNAADSSTDRLKADG